jgi:GTP-binding protein HflX
LDRGDGACERSLDELSELVRTAGGEPVATITQARSRPDAHTLIGSGKVQEVREAVDALGLDVCVINEPLRPRQQRALEATLEVPVVDRTEVILDIFAQRAQTREGKVQVELAQLEYLLPRLTGRGTVLSRLGGGIGTRGPGETALEVDRRRIRLRVNRLRQEIEDIRSRRTVERGSREVEGIFTVALVGYTNAGKSTLLNALAGADAYVDDRLFATLDPMTRAVELPDGHRVLMTDTVGFIDRLPHNLVAAFAATLEETVHADLLLHVVDASHPAMNQKIDAVYTVLEELGALDQDSVLVLNKIDQVSADARGELPSDEDVVMASALTGEGLDGVRDAIAARAEHRLQRVTYLLPFDRLGILADLHNHGRVLEEKYVQAGCRVVADVPREVAGRLREYVATE